MEVSVVNSNSLRIKSKNAIFLVNPEKKIDSDVVMLTRKPETYSGLEDKLVFDGPGEYEVAGVSIKGEKSGSETSFDLLEENQRLLILSSSAVEKSKETEDYTATILIADGDMNDDSLANITSGVVMVLGNKVPGEHENIKKSDKVNLKKIEEYKGSIVHLTKN